MLHDNVYDYVHILCDCVCLFVFVLRRSHDGRFYVVTWELKENSICVYGGVEC